jgi:nucleoid-associated protein YgaU
MLRTQNGEWSPPFRGVTERNICAILIDPRTPPDRMGGEEVPYLTAMPITNLRDSNSMGPRFTDLGELSHCYRFLVFALLFLSCTLFRMSNCQAQDVAEAARQQRARKENQQKPPKHIYTEEDLRRSRILTPEDGQRVEAKKRGQAPPAAEKPAEAIDVQSAPQQLPLGDIARQFQKQKQMRQPRQSAEFHLPFSNPSFAAPVRPQPPLRAPSNRKDPFLRPRILRPSISSTVSALAPVPVPLAPARPVGPIARPSTPALHTIIVQRGDSLWKLAQHNLGKGSRWPELLALNPRIANPGHIKAGAQLYIPTRYSARGGVSKISVRKGETLWQLAQTHLGRATYWPCIARANPAIQDANRIYEGQELLLPASCGP